MIVKETTINKDVNKGSKINIIKVLSDADLVFIRVELQIRTITSGYQDCSNLHSL